MLIKKRRQSVKYANAKELEVSKKTIGYFFEILSRAEPNKPIIICLNARGAGLANASLDYIRHFLFLLRTAYPNTISKIGTVFEKKNSKKYGKLKR